MGGDDCLLPNLVSTSFYFLFFLVQFSDFLIKTFIFLTRTSEKFFVVENFSFFS